MNLLEKINKLKRKRVLNDLLSLLFLLLSFAILSFLIFLTTHTFPFAISFSLIFILLILYLKRDFKSLPFFQDYSKIKTGILLEENFPILRGVLTPAISLAEKEKELLSGKEGYSPALIRAAISEAEKMIGGLRLESILNRRLLRRSAFASLFTSSITLLFPLFFPKLFLFAFNSKFFPKKIPLAIIIHPKEVITLPNKEVKIGISLSSPYRIPSGSLLLGKEKKAIRFQNNSAEFRLFPKEEMTFTVSVLKRVAFGRIRMTTPLEITSLTALLSPPPYTSLPPTSIQFPKEISLLKGTEVKLEGKINKLAKITLSPFPNLIPESDTFSFTFKATNETLVVLNFGEEKSLPIKINYLPDESPFVRFLLPGRDMEIPESMGILLLLYALDDFGLKDITISARIGKEGESQPFKVYQKKSNQKADTISFLWDLTNLNLLPGDEITYYAVVWDNDPDSPKSHKSDEYRLRFPTLAEIYSKTVEKRREIESSLSSQLSESEKVSEEIEEIISALKKERKLSWEERKSLAAAFQKKEDIISQLKKLREEVARAMEELLASAVYDRETMEKLEELERLLAEILPKELREEIAKLREALRKEKKDFAKILERMKMTSEELKKMLERSVEVLKRLQEEAKLKELEKKLAEIGKEQKKIEEAMKGLEREELAKREKAIEEALKSWEKELKELALSERENQKSLDGIKSELEKKPLSEIAKGIKEKMSEGKLAAAKKMSENLRKEIAEFANRLRELSSGMKKKREEEIIQRLKRSAQELIEIVETTEDLEKETRERRDEKRLIEKSRGISEGVRTVADSLIALAQRHIQISPRIADGLFKAQSALAEGGSSLFEKNYPRAEGKFSESKVLINNTIEGLIFLLRSAPKGGMGGDLEDFLSALADGLKEMSELLSEMGGIPIPLPSPLSAEQMAAIERLLGRHRSLREKLEEMMKGLTDKPGLTSSMAGIIEEMKRIEQDLEKLNVTRELVEREDRVFQRLLDVERSLRKREAEEKREREVGKEFEINEKPILPKDLGERKRVLQEELLRSLQENYPREYYRLIKAYFDALLYE